MTQTHIESLTLLSPSDQVDVSNCDREPIHIPGYIQPHGVLFALHEPALTIVQVSENSNEWLGLTPEQLLNQPLSCLLSEDEMHAVRQCLAGDFNHVNPLQIELNTPRGKIVAHSVVHSMGSIAILEIEFGQITLGQANLPERNDLTYFDFYRQVKAPIESLQKATNFEELCNQLVANVRHITGFDRVMIYRFAPSGSGDVIAEALRPDLVPYLGLRYPASDIPLQARHLYTLNHLRLVPDVVYTPVALIHTLNPITQAPLDLSWSVLRSVSPIHVEYMQNMGVRSSMSISLMRDRQLWGLISCHHSEPKLIPYFQRTVCEFIGQMGALEINAKDKLRDRDYQIKLNTLKTSFFKSISRQSDVLAALTQSSTDLLDLVGATGAVISFQDEVVVVGKTPSQDVLKPLIASLISRLETDDIVQSVCLAKDYPDAESYSDVASGLLAMAIASTQNFYILWFRPEVSQTVTWGGNPNKPEMVDDHGLVRLSPRKSFAAWQENVRHTSLPWKLCEYEAALELRNAIIHVTLRHAAELSKLNVELERSNIDLDSFAYVASHDLKEPLRGIHNYSSFLIEDYGEILDAEGVSKLQTLTRLTRRMELLIDSLLHYSQLGRAELANVPIDLNVLAQEVVDLFKITTTADSLDITINLLPTIVGDRSQISELITNLVSNAIKYNDNPLKTIEIGCLDSDAAQCLQRERPQLDIPSGSQIIYVRDNGIGIDRSHFDDVFQIFKRLHTRDEYGGGTGAGLMIVKKIVDRHGGKIWIESTLGHGTTFYVSVPAPENNIN
jgi:two-component system, chemotaxis family, sensor kinase Cph1